MSSVETLVWCGDRLFSAGIDEFVHEHDILTGSIKVYFLDFQGMTDTVVKFAYLY